MSSKTSTERNTPVREAVVTESSQRAVYRLNKTPEPIMHGVETVAKLEDAAESYDFKGYEIDIIWSENDSEWIADHNLQKDIIGSFPRIELKSTSRGDTLEDIKNKLMELKESGEPVHKVWLDVKTTQPTLDKLGIDIKEAIRTSDVPTFLKEIFVFGVNGVADVVNDIITTLTKAADNGPLEVVKAVSQLIDDGFSVLNGIVDSIPETAEFFLDCLYGAFKALEGSLESILNLFAEKVEGLIKNFSESDNIFEALFKTITGAPGELLGLPIEMIKEVGTEITGAFTDFALKLQGYMHDISLDENSEALDVLYRETVLPLLEAGFSVKIDAYGSKVIGNYFAEKLPLHQNLEIHAPFDKATSDRYFDSLDYDVPLENRSYGPNSLKKAGEFKDEDYVAYWTLNDGPRAKQSIDDMESLSVDEILLQSAHEYMGSDEYKSADKDDPYADNLMRYIEESRVELFDNFKKSDVIELDQAFHLSEDSFIGMDEFSMDGDGEFRLDSEDNSVEVDYDGDGHVDKTVLFLNDFRVEEMTIENFAF